GTVEVTVLRGRRWEWLVRRHGGPDGWGWCGGVDGDGPKDKAVGVLLFVRGMQVGTGFDLSWRYPLRRHAAASRCLERGSPTPHTPLTKSPEPAHVPHPRHHRGAAAVCPARAVRLLPRPGPRTRRQPGAPGHRRWRAGHRRDVGPRPCRPRLGRRAQAVLRRPQRIRAAWRGAGGTGAH